MLVGRAAECAALDSLLAAGVTGRSAALVVRGEPGIGKTALLQYAAARADGWQIVCTGGVESEMELPFAALRQLCASLLQNRDSLPLPQREALAVAFGLHSGPPPDRFLVGLAVLTLLSEASEQAPVLCLVDDTQWLDQSSVLALAFVARRLQAEAVMLLFAERATPERSPLDRLPEIRLEGLDNGPAQHLLTRAVAGPLDSQVQARILAETRGNPLALLELPQTASPVELAGGFALTSAIPVQGRIEASFLARVHRLPMATQRLLLAAAAEPTGDPALLWAAAAELKLVPEDVAPAEADHLVEVGAQVTFRHPLLRSAIYRTVTPAQRRSVHSALASVTDASLDPDRRAWHLAQATLAPDETVATELQRSAGRALVRGGLAAAAAFLDRAATLTPDPGRRARRELEAARTKQLSGASEAALVLLGQAASGPLQALDRALLQRLHGEIALDLRRGGDAVPLLLDAAKRLESFDPALARETYLEALRAASIGGRLGAGVRAAGEAARRARPAVGTPRGLDLLLDGLALRFTDGYAASASTLRRAMDALLDEGSRPGQDVRWPWLARRVAPDLFEDQTWEALATRNVEIAREAGALTVLPLALHSLATKRIFDGDLDAAETMLAEADAIVDATGTSALVLTRFLLAGWRGDEAGATMLFKGSQAATLARGEGVALSFAEYARAVLCNGLGHYDAATQAARSAVECDELMTSVWSLPELIEGATRSGKPEMATAALEQLLVCTGAAGTEVALGIAARSEALLSPDDAAEELYQQAVGRLGRTGNRSALARAHLLYGEWLRREGRRVDAREQLHTAYDSLTKMGMSAFANRAHRELLATGERVRKRTDDTRHTLTAQETQIAGLAAAGRTNLEIGAELFLSPRTVEWHISKVFTKLDISSRRQLRGILPDAVRTKGV